MALRFIEESDEVLIEALEGVKNNGFINYFGMQRFGKGFIPTHKIGIAVIKEDFKRAVKYILDKHIKDYLNKHPVFNFDDICKDRDLMHDFVRSIHRRYVLEHKILSRLRSSGEKGFFSAFMALNRQLQCLYPHAYQSYVFNRTASERIKRFGMKVLVGDIVKKIEIIPEDLSEVEDEKPQWKLSICLKRF